MTQQPNLQARQKSTGLAYVLLILFGSFGAHQFYIGNIKRGLTILGLWITGLTFSSIGAYQAFSYVQARAMADLEKLQAQQANLQAMTDALNKGKAPPKPDHSPTELLGPSEPSPIMFIIGGVFSLAFSVLLLIDLFTIPSQIRKREEQASGAAVHQNAAPSNQQTAA